MDNKQRREELLNVAKSAGEKQRKGLVVNFDEAYEAYKSQGNEIEVTFEGETYSFPSEPSAEVMTYILRRGAKMTNEMGLELLRIIIGEQFLDAISKSRAPFSLIVETVLNPIMQVYGFGGARLENDGTEGNEPTPES